MRKRFWIPILLIIFGVFFPLLFDIEHVGLHHMIEKLKNNPDGSTLMLTALILVFLNTLRALPHYLGALLLGDALGRKYNRPILKIAVPVVIIPAVYLLINSYYSMNYHFGGPAILLLLSILFLQLFGRQNMRPLFMSFVFSQLLFGYQWLDIVPALTSFGFGGGEVSVLVKSTSSAIGFENTLSIYSLLFSAVFIVHALVFAVYLTVVEQKWKMRKDLESARLEMVEARSGREALHLVHDLKTPLSLMEGLNSLIQMKTDDPDIQTYTGKISDSIEATSDMVSEILYDEKKNWCSLHTLIEYVRQNKLSESSTIYQFELQAPSDIEIYINKIRMTRAIVNLIDNAGDAVEGQKNAQVVIRSEVHAGIWIGIEDNGPGIKNRDLQKIWNAGFSTKEHPGLGLSFVKNVIEEHGASLDIESEPGVGTTFWIHFPKERTRYEHTDHR
ncbi:sensor histidine kinase [Salimicrobium humidisoli]|uniref:histidine kinase n=1 Tax=Salimicrobium humidisoli TaxID=2029857 RepID=A0ABX4HVZ9_9BACI|nr:HAMP domain-containing sensor histidine kinase [Salimicrobium humidisoli]PBB07110.1 two-component sensor histidine kinase [Salimicrobium humidisoli]